MPLHRTPKGDSPERALSQLVRRIERAGGTVVQITETESEWLVQATVPPRAAEWQTRTSHGRSLMGTVSA